MGVSKNRGPKNSTLNSRIAAVPAGSEGGGGDGKLTSGLWDQQPSSECLNLTNPKA